MLKHHAVRVRAMCTHQKSTSQMSILKRTPHICPHSMTCKPKSLGRAKHIHSPSSDTSASHKKTSSHVNANPTQFHTDQLHTLGAINRQGSRKVFDRCRGNPAHKQTIYGLCPLSSSEDSHRGPHSHNSTRNWQLPREPIFTCLPVTTDSIKKFSQTQRKNPSSHHPCP